MDQRAKVPEDKPGGSAAAIQVTRAKAESLGRRLSSITSAAHGPWTDARLTLTRDQMAVHSTIGWTDIALIKSFRAAVGGQGKINPPEETLERHSEL